MQQRKRKAPEDIAHHDHHHGASLTPTEKKPNPNGTNIFTPPVVAPQPTYDPNRDR